MTGRLETRRLGTVGYQDALDLQAQLVEERRRGQIPDLLLFLEHPPVITLGVKTRNNRTNIVATDAQLMESGVAVFETGRGGDVTYHGPGQLVGYPIFDLNPDRRDVHRYVRDIEQALIDAVAAFGISADRVEGLTGIWAGNDKLAAIGVRISRWITSHGFALNVSTNLAHFDLIVPCGIQGRGVTSIEQLVGHPVPMADVETAVEAAFRAVFE
ncbi:MAG: lipoyl(octanoyl) transferase LipB [Vicinamibacterales bacterium]